MKHKYAAKMLSLLLAVVLCATAFAIPAFASGGEETTVPTAETEPTEAAPEGTGDIQLQIPDELLNTILSLLGSLGTSSGEETETTQTGTVTTNGGRLNVRTGAGLDNYAFTQLPNGTTVEVIGTEGDWYMIRLPEKIGYVYRVSPLPFQEV